MAVCYFMFPETYANLVTDKLAGETDSGAKRLFSPIGIVETFFGLPPLQWFSGVGFGYTYANAGISVLLNCGLSGFVLFAFGFLFQFSAFHRTGEESPSNRLGGDVFSVPHFGCRTVSSNNLDVLGNWLIGNWLGSGSVRLRRTISLLFKEKNLETVCFNSFK